MLKYRDLTQIDLPFASTLLQKMKPYPTWSERERETLSSKFNSQATHARILCNFGWCELADYRLPTFQRNQNSRELSPRPFNDFIYDIGRI